MCQPFSNKEAWTQSKFLFSFLSSWFMKCAVIPFGWLNWWLLPRSWGPIHTRHELSKANCHWHVWQFVFLFWDEFRLVAGAHRPLRFISSFCGVLLQMSAPLSVWNYADDGMFLFRRWRLHLSRCAASAGLAGGRHCRCGRIHRWYSRRDLALLVLLQTVQF